VVGVDTAAVVAVGMSALSVVSLISGLVLGWKGKSRTEKQDTAAEAREGATIKADIEYIKRGVDDMKVEQKLQGQKYDEIAERVTRVEESVKQAHHRLNRLDGGKE
jgi:hypothetical protein